MKDQQNESRFRDNLQGEVDGAYLYEALAHSETNPILADIYRRMAASEKRHAEFWLEKLGGGQLPDASWRPRALGWVARRFGAQIVLPTVNSLEQRDSNRYRTQPDATAAGLAGDERSHARLLETITGTKGLEGSAVARFEGRHKAIGGNALRAAVLGVNDGLCSNLSLVMGVAGADLSSHAILITGLAGLLACASSMAMGEWLSVKSSRELYQRQIQIEAAEIEQSPAEEVEELALIYQAKGLGEAEARGLAERLVSDPATALDTLAREELGIDPLELGGSAWEAAAMSFTLSIVGAALPVLPFAFLQGNTAVLTSLAVSSVGLFLIGAAITLMTGRGVAYSGGRQLALGWLAASLTFGIGRLFRAGMGG